MAITNNSNTGDGTKAILNGSNNGVFIAVHYDPHFTLDLCTYLGFMSRYRSCLESLRSTVSLVMLMLHLILGTHQLFFSLY